MTDTKITVKIIPSLLASLSDQLSTCFIKRDAFIEHLIETETPHLAKEMAGKRQSNQARQYIAGELKRKGTTTVNVKIKQSTANCLNELVKETNMVRDAFINQIILLLTASPQLLALAEIPRSGPGGDLSTSPLSAMTELVGDPFFHYRQWAGDAGIYLEVFDWHFPFLACYLEDSRVPGTAAHKAEKDMFDNLVEL